MGSPCGRGSTFSLWMGIQHRSRKKHWESLGDASSLRTLAPGQYNGSSARVSVHGRPCVGAHGHGLCILQD